MEKCYKQGRDIIKCEYRDNTYGCECCKRKHVYLSDNEKREAREIKMDMLMEVSIETIKKALYVGSFKEEHTKNMIMINLLENILRYSVKETVMVDLEMSKFIFDLLH